MYSIYTTTGFVIDSHPYGEAGKILLILTNEFGLVHVVAQGIRLENSKLRYHVQKYSIGLFSLVRGKEFLRLTNAKEICQKKISSQSKQLLARVALILRRFLHGEEIHSGLYQCVESCVLFLEKTSEISNEQLITLESVIVLRILRELGYIGTHPMFDDSMLSCNLSLKLLDELATKRVLMNSHINKALKESHL